MNKQFKVLLTLIATMGFCGAANAAWVDLNYGAHVDLSTTVYDPYALYEFSDTEQTHAFGQLIVSIASTTLSTGEARLGSGLLSVNVTNQAGEAAWARAFIHDTLTFHVAGGGSADVLAQISGNWKVMGQAVGQSELVTYSLVLDPGAIFSGSANAFTATTNTFTSGTLIDGRGGTYTDGGLWRVQDGRSYNITATVTASTGGLATGSAYIDDPLTFQLPSGVTFTSASGSTYASAVPLPAAVWLFGSGLLGLVGIARRKKTA